MLKKKVFIFFVFIFLILIALTSYLAIDSKFRRSVYSKLIGGYKLINYHIVGGYTFYREFESASKRIIKYIEFSQKFSKGKNSMLQGIIDVTDLITSKAYTQEDFNKMEKVYIKIDEITDDIYKNHIWLARSLSDNDIEKSKKHLNKALKLSRSSEEAYREIIRIFSKNQEIVGLIKNYCDDYFNEFAGGSVGRLSTGQNENNFFYGNNATFAVSRNENYTKLYPKLISDLNIYKRYDFIFEDEENINRFFILKNFFPGSKVSIKNIILYNDKENKINFNNLVIHSSFSYILDQSNNEIVFLTGNKNNDILKFNFIKTYNDINKISLELKLEKLPLTNNFVCSKINEN